MQTPMPQYHDNKLATLSTYQNKEFTNMFCCIYKQYKSSLYIKMIYVINLKIIIVKSTDILSYILFYLISEQYTTELV